MVRRIRWAASSLALVAVGAGCVQNAPSRIAENQPYLGRAPEPVQPLPKPTERPLGEAPRHEAGDARWIPRGGISNRWECIVLHHSDSDKSTPQGMREWHMRGRGWDELGYHFVIGNGVGYGDGEVFVGERWRRQMHGAHCKTPNNYYNDHGIGICLIGDLDAHAPTRRQMQSLARLVAFLSSECQIPRQRIYTHGGVTHKTACPGRRFSLPALLQQMSARPLAAASE